MEEITRELNPVFIGKTPEQLGVVYVEKMNELLASTGEEGATLQLDPDITAQDFVPALQRVITGTLQSRFQPILLVTILNLYDRAKEARAHGEYDTGAIAAQMSLNDIATFIKDHQEVKEKWRRLDLVDFLLSK